MWEGERERWNRKPSGFFLGAGGAVGGEGEVIWRGRLRCGELRGELQLQGGGGGGWRAKIDSV